MKKLILIIILIFLISFILVYSIEDSKFIDIKKEFENKDRVDVIVWLKDNEFTKPEYQIDLDKKREEIKKLQNELLADLGNDFEIKFRYKITNGFAGSITKKGFEKLKDNNKVDKIYLDGEVQEALIESRPLIRADLVENNLGFSGLGVVVCEVDSGIDYNHPDLGGCFGTFCKVVDGYDFCADPGCFSQDPDPMDERGHGTHAAGIIASNHINYRGIAPDANLVANKMLSYQGTGTWGAAAAAVDHCVFLASVYNIKVVALGFVSTGTTTYTPSTCPNIINPSIQNAFNAGMLITAPSGNVASTGGITYPACAPGVTSVGATYDADVGAQVWTYCTDFTTQTDQIACFTNRASNLNLLAPGSIIHSTTSSIGVTCGAPFFGGYAPCSGTSMAQAHIAGTAALLYEQNPSLTPSQVEDRIKNSGINIFDSATGLTFKRVDAYNAALPQPQLSVSTNTPQIGSTLYFNLNNGLPFSIYFLLISTGTSPGILLPDGRVIPLNSDGLFMLSVLYPAVLSALGFSNHQATLNNLGQSTATWNIPLFLNPIAGFTIYFGFITIDFSFPFPQAITGISNAVPVTLIAAPLPPPAPTGLYASCPSPGNSAGLSWNPSSGANYYNVKVDNLANPWTGSCSVLNPGDFCFNNIPSTSYTFTSSPGATYNWWINACNINGCSTAAYGPVFNCTTAFLPVLLVHGIYSSDAIWDEVETALRNNGFNQVYRLGEAQAPQMNSIAPGLVPNNGVIMVLAKQLTNAINNVKAFTGASKVHIVAHSMGGLVTRWYIKYPGYNNNIGKFITLGTPNEGAPIAKGPLSWFAGFTVGSIGSNSNIQDEARKNMIPGSPFLKLLNKDFNTYGIIHTEIAGTALNPIACVFAPSYCFSVTDTIVPMSSVDIPNINCFQRNVVHAVGLGLLQYNAYYTDSATIDAVVDSLKGNPIDLEPCPNELVTDQNNIQTLMVTNTILPGQVQIPISNMNFGRSFVAILNWSTGNIDLSLISPSGNVINSSNYLNFNATYVNGTFANNSLVQFSLEQPEQGNWGVKIFGSGIAVPTAYTLNILMEKNISIRVSSNKDVYNPNELVLLNTTLMNNSLSVLNANVVAKVTKPNNNIILLTLFDDGLHNDGVANDGVYGNSFSDTSLQGTYIIDVNASIANVFDIKETLAAFVEVFPDLTINTNDINFNPLQPVAGNNVTISALIYNIGNGNAINTTIFFYDGTVDNGTLIGEKIIDVLQSGSSQTSVSVNLSVGIHDIRVLITPFNEFLELNYSNNLANKTLSVVTSSITSCTTITASGNYVLGNDITFSVQPSCVEIQANNVVLDCQSHTMTGPGSGNLNNGNAISVYSNNSVVKNCILRNSGRGVGVGGGGNNNLIVNNTIYNMQEGINNGGSQYNTYSNNTVFNNLNGLGRAFTIWWGGTPSTQNIVTGNIFTNSKYGIDLGFPGGAGIFGNKFYNNYIANNSIANARDFAGLNFWNTTKTAGTNIIGGPFIGGNFWSDYLGNDTNGDGIGDTNLPYNSNGQIANGGDYLPLVY